MPNNALVTGPPRVGKSTALDRFADTLRERGRTVGGLAAPERREDGERVGFDIVDRETGDGERMAHVALPADPSVGTYGVDVQAIDRVAATTVPRAVSRADCVVIDEIGPMQAQSDVFVCEVRRVLDADRPLVASIATAPSTGFVQAVRERADVDVVEVTTANRDDVPETLVAWLEAAQLL